MLQHSLSSYILAGGKSSRFGSDKALAMIDGSPLICRLAKQLRECNLQDNYIVADREDRYQQLALTSIPDLRPQLGPLGGLWTALKHRLDHLGPGWILLLPCDLIDFRVSWITDWLHSIPASTTPDSVTALAIAFYDQYWQPLPALYHTNLLDKVIEAVDANRLSLQSLLNSLDDFAIPVSSQSSSDIRTANTPDELWNHLSSKRSQENS
jgi:molybdopterin-guanine dinucleotide biosynthesis protein A